MLARIGAGRLWVNIRRQGRLDSTIRARWVRVRGLPLRRAKSKGVVAGVAQIRHFEEVRRGVDASDLDTIAQSSG